MKKFFIFLFILFFILGCKKVFKEDYQNSLQLNTRNDYEQAMAGLYMRLYNSMQFGAFVSGISPLGGGFCINNVCYRQVFFMPYGNEDDMIFISNSPGKMNSPGKCRFANDQNYLESSDTFNISMEAKWDAIYQTILCANDLIKKTGDINKKLLVNKRIIGEVYFIRAYSYYMLVRIFGQVPIIDNTDVNYIIKKSSFSDIYNFIEADLLKAINLLPPSNNEARVQFTTPHRGTAKALLAEFYLTMAGYPIKNVEKYVDAARIAAEVIDSSAVFGFGLVPDLANLWNGTQVKNSETVLSLYDQSGIANNGIVGYINKVFTPSPWGTGGVSNFFFDIYVAPDFYNSFPKNYRKEVTFQTRNLKYNWSTDYGYSFLPINVIHYDSIDNCTPMEFRKFYTCYYLNDAIGSDPYNLAPYNGKVLYILRYAQTLLTYAEAKARSGSLDASAYDAVNQVRRRANKVDLFSPSPYDLTPGLSSKQFADSVVQERQWELCAEPEGRWFDLLRLDMVKLLPEIKKKQNIRVFPILIDRNTYFCPIPEKEQVLDPNLK